MNAPRQVHSRASQRADRPSWPPHNARAARFVHAKRIGRFAASQVRAVRRRDCLFPLRGGERCECRFAVEYPGDPDFEIASARNTWQVVADAGRARSVLDPDCRSVRTSNQIRRERSRGGAGHRGRLQNRGKMHREPLSHLPALAPRDPPARRRARRGDPRPRPLRGRVARAHRGIARGPPGSPGHLPPRPGPHPGATRALRPAVRDARHPAHPAVAGSVQ